MTEYEYEKQKLGEALSIVEGICRAHANTLNSDGAQGRVMCAFWEVYHAATFGLYINHKYGNKEK